MAANVAGRVFVARKQRPEHGARIAATHAGNRRDHGEDSQQHMCQTSHVRIVDTYQGTESRPKSAAHTSCEYLTGAPSPNGEAAAKGLQLVAVFQGQRAVVAATGNHGQPPIFGARARSQQNPPPPRPRTPMRPVALQRAVGQYSANQRAPAANTSARSFDRALLVGTMFKRAAWTWCDVAGRVQESMQVQVPRPWRWLFLRRNRSLLPPPGRPPRVR